MRAARIHEVGSLPQVDEIAPPDAAAALRVSMSALNPVDITIGTGRFYGGTPPTPYVIGSEAVGRMPDGRRVWARGRQLMTELIDPGSAEWIFDLPDGLSDEGALVCGTAGLTAWLAVSWRAPVQLEDTVLVLGASGTLGSVAVQGAKLLGARRVIGAARRADLVPAAADQVFDLNGEDAFPEATYIVDALWGEPFEQAMAAAAAGVRVVHVGQSAGAAATLQSAWVRGKVASIFGLSLFALPEQAAETGYRQLAEHVRDGAVSVESETYPLDAIAEAWQRQASGSPGSKILVELG
jgi:NADPH2:quinone reductase